MMVANILFFSGDRKAINQKFINIYQVSRVRRLLFLCFVFVVFFVLQSGQVASFNKDSRFNNN